MNHKRVYRIYCEKGLHLRRKRPKHRISIANRLDRPNLSNIDQCWSMDFVADERLDNKRIRCLTIVDNWSRECLSIDVSPFIKGDNVVEVISILRSKPKRIQMDNRS